MQEARKGPPFFTEAQGQFQKDRVVELVIVRPAPITPPDRVGGPELDVICFFVMMGNFWRRYWVNWIASSGVALCALMIVFILTPLGLALVLNATGSPSSGHRYQSGSVRSRLA